MADASYDVVVVGGGTKSMVTAMYLAKYGGMSVCVLERRRELCQGLSSEQGIVPGFTADYHASMMMAYNFEPLPEDFPGIEEKGLKVVECLGNTGIIDVDDQSCWVFYNPRYDPNQERTAKEIARFSQRDAETWLKMWDVIKPGSEFATAQLQEFLTPPPPPGEPSPIQKWGLKYAMQPDSLIDTSWFSLPAFHCLNQLWESKLLQYHWLRFLVFSGMFIDMCPGITWLFIPYFVSRDPGSLQGGTHNAAHAYQRVLQEHGGTWHTWCEVDKIIIENGKAKGVRLTDGTQIEAKKMVVTGVDINTLCLKLLGPDHISERILRKVGALVYNLKGLAWYSWFLHELPDYKAAKYNPDISQTAFLVLGSSRVEDWWEAMELRKMHKFPTVDGKLLVLGHSINDKTRAPEGKHMVLTDFDIPTATALSEKEWLKYKKTHAEEALVDWQRYAPNMTWDNVIGFAPQTSYDAAVRGSTFWPEGNAGPLDQYPGQSFCPDAPFPEMSRYKVPGIENLYVTGSWKETSSNCNAGYVCYRVIADELGLRKPWEEKGRPY